MVVRPAGMAFPLFFSICAGLAYGWYQPTCAAEYPNALIVYPNATEVWSGKVGGTDQLTYRVDAEFPAAGVIGWISHELEERGWEALTYDYMNPNLPSGQVQGWSQFRDERKEPEQYVHQWIGDWRDSSGNIIRYVFHYRSPKGYTSNLRSLEVASIYVTAPLAKQMQEEGERLK